MKEEGNAWVEVAMFAAAKAAEDRDTSKNREEIWAEVVRWATDRTT